MLRPFMEAPPIVLRTYRACGLMPVRGGYVHVLWRWL